MIHLLVIHSSYPGGWVREGTNCKLHGCEVICLLVIHSSYPAGWVQEGTNCLGTRSSIYLSSIPRRYNEDLELEDAVHTAILTLKVSTYLMISVYRLPLPLPAHSPLPLPSPPPLPRPSPTRCDQQTSNSDVSNIKFLWLLDGGGVHAYMKKCTVLYDWFVLYTRMKKCTVLYDWFVLYTSM